MGKTKIMVSDLNLNLLKNIWKNPCGVCQTGVGINSVFCGGCLYWVHKKCYGIKGYLRRDPDFSCAGCLGKARPIDGRLVKEVLVDDKKVEALQEFCYLGDWLQSHTANRLRASSANNFLSTPNAICHV